MERPKPGRWLDISVETHIISKKNQPLGFKRIKVGSRFSPFSENFFEYFKRALGRRGVHTKIHDPVIEFVWAVSLLLSVVSGSAYHHSHDQDSYSARRTS